MKKSLTTVDLGRSTSHKILAAIALVGLVVCGVMIGWGFRVHDTKSVFSDKQCENLSNKITWAINDGDYDKLNEAQKIFAENCAGYVPVETAPVKTEPVDENLSACQRIEELLIERLYSENSEDLDAHISNVITYEKLVQTGCPENQKKWQSMVAREMEIGKALWNTEYFQNELAKHKRGPGHTADSTCQGTERAILGGLHNGCEHVGTYDRSGCYLHNAELYASLVQKGCPENRGKYKELALQQIDIATALKAEKEMENDEVESVIDTYKKLQMQEQAQQILDKVQKLTNPAIDFILQMEKIINE